jgi:hypothetical protein
LNEPREPGQQLEQQREELPVGEPEQQQPGQPEQQHWVPRGAGPSSTIALDDALADPAGIPSAKRDALRQRAVNTGPVSVAEWKLRESSGPLRAPCRGVYPVFGDAVWGEPR